MQCLTYHAVIFSVKKGGCVKETTSNYLKQIVCLNTDNNQTFCNQCVYCKKIDAETYYDLVNLNASDNDFSKDKIIALQNQFSLAGLEARQKKICLINNFDLANIQVFNSLLSFLEITNNDNYFIFVTKNINMIPKTIISRCQILDILNSPEKWKQLTKEFALNPSEIEVIKGIYWTFDEADKALKNGEYMQLKQVCEKIIHSDELSNLSNLADSLEQFKKMPYSEIKKVITYVMMQDNLSDKYAEFTNLISLLEYNPGRVAIYDRILKSLKTVKYE